MENSASLYFLTIWGYFKRISFIVYDRMFEMNRSDLCT